MESIQQARLRLKREAALEEHLTSSFDAVMREAGLDLLLVSRQPVLEHGIADLLAIDGSGRSWIVELKAGVAPSKIVTQALRYVDDLSRRKSHSLGARTATFAPEGLLRSRFLARFGSELHTSQDQAPGMLLLAEDFSAELRQTISALKTYGVPVLAFHLVEAGEGLSLIPLNEREAFTGVDGGEDADAQNLESSGGNPRKASRSAYRVPVRDDSIRFWDSFSEAYPHPVAPIGFIARAHARWQETTALGTAPTPAANLGLLAREIRALAAERGDWVQVYLRPDQDMDEVLNPRSVLLAQRHRGSVYRRTAYVRSDALPQRVQFVD